MNYRHSVSNSMLDAPQRLANRDLTAGAAIWLSVLFLALAVALDAFDGKLGTPFAVAFVLVCLTIPLAVRTEALLAATLLPAALLFGSLWVLAAAFPGLIQVQGVPANTGTFGLLMAQVIDYGVAFLVAEFLALAIVGARLFLRSRQPSHTHA
jgi:hypothetical protein